MEIKLKVNDKNYVMLFKLAALYKMDLEEMILKNIHEYLLKIKQLIKDVENDPKAMQIVQKIKDSDMQTLSASQIQRIYNVGFKLATNIIYYMTLKDD